MKIMLNLRPVIFCSIAFATVAANMTISTAAQAKCSDDQSAISNCWDELTSAAKSTVGAHSELERAGSVGEAVRNCMNCAGEAAGKMIRDGVTNTSPPPAGGATVRRQGFRDI